MFYYISKYIMEDIIQNVLKKQNEELIKKIASDYNLYVDMLIQKYHTPSFYSISIDETKSYQVISKPV